MVQWVIIIIVTTTITVPWWILKVLTLCTTGNKQINK